jgi:hypothetical protein
MLETSAGSIDVEGSTIFHRATSKTEPRVHNDRLDPHTCHARALDDIKQGNELRAIAYPSSLTTASKRAHPPRAELAEMLGEKIHRSAPGQLGRGRIVLEHR